MQVGREVVRHMMFDVGIRMSKSNIHFEKWPTVSFSYAITVQDFCLKYTSNSMKNIVLLTCNNSKLKTLLEIQHNLPTRNRRNNNIQIPRLLKKMNVTEVLFNQNHDRFVRKLMKLIERVLFIQIIVTLIKSCDTRS